MNDEAKREALQTYFDLMTMNGGARVYRVAKELGIFEAVGKGAATPRAVAEVCRLQERPVRLLLDTLCGMKAMQGEGETYSLSPVMQFLAGNYSNLSDEYWDHLPALLKTGVPIARMDRVAESEDQYRKQVTALAWMMQPAAEAAAVMLGVGRDRTGLKILDVGAGSAVWSLTFARKDKCAVVTALDWPAVLEIASASAQTLGMGDRFVAWPGNYHETDLPAETYNLAILANVTHIETPEGNQALFRKLGKALMTDGELLIVDVMPGQEAGDLARSLYALGLGLRTEKGQVYTPGALQCLLTEAGFKEATFMPIPVAPQTMGMLLAKKGA